MYSNQVLRLQDERFQSKHQLFIQKLETSVYKISFTIEILGIAPTSYNLNTVLYNIIQKLYNIWRYSCFYQIDKLGS